MFQKLRNRRGETLSEALIGILIITLSAAMLATMIASAVRINIRTNEATDEIYAELSFAESGQNAAAGAVTVNGQPVNVDYYSQDEDALTAYRKAADGEPGTP